MNYFGWFRLHIPLHWCVSLYHLQSLRLNMPIIPIVYCCCLLASTSTWYFVYLVHILLLYTILSYALLLLCPWLLIIPVFRKSGHECFTKYSNIPTPLLYSFCSSSVTYTAFGIFLMTWNPGVLGVSVTCCVLTILPNFHSKFLYRCGCLIQLHVLFFATCILHPRYSVKRYCVQF